MFGIGAKVWAYVALAGVLVAFSTWAYGAIYDAGFNTAIIQAQEAAILRQNAAIAEARADWAASQEIGATQILIEEKIVEVTRDVIKEVPVVVERIVEITPECADLGPDFLRVFNDAIRAGSGPGPDAPSNPPDPDDSMPSA